MWSLYIAGVAGLTLGGVGVGVFYPAFCYYAYIRFTRWLSGAKWKSIQVAAHEWVYVERGAPSQAVPTLVLLHGFSSSKDNWSRVIKNLPNDGHIIAVDLPGHGETPTIPLDGAASPYDIYVKGFHQFLQAIGLGQSELHLAGLSMGGTIAGLYGATYPQNVSLISFICPAMETPNRSAMREEMDASGRKLLLPDNLEELQLMIRWSVHSNLPLPRQLLKGVLEDRRQKALFYTSLWIKLQEYHGTLNKVMSQVKSPTQIIWGADDKMVHVSGADVLQKGLPDVRRVDIIPSCGHAVNLDSPQTLARLLADFGKTMRKSGMEQ